VPQWGTFHGGYMTHSLFMVFVHIVFATKDRYPFLEDQVIRDEVFNYLAGVCEKKRANALVVGGVADHVHLLCNPGRTNDIQTLVRNLKVSSSKWIKAKWPGYLDGFQWQTGYGAFSTSTSQVPEVIAYIQNQEERHKHQSYNDELQSIIARAEAILDESDIH